MWSAEGNDLFSGSGDTPGEKHRRHREKDCGCRGRRLPVLRIVSDRCWDANWQRVLHRLKLVTGVDISTRPVRRLGREGKAKNRTSLRAAAEVKRKAFRLSITMMIIFLTL